jgi:hypothetical protein
MLLAGCLQQRWLALLCHRMRLSAPANHCLLPLLNKRLPSHLLNQSWHLSLSCCCWPAGARVLVVSSPAVHAELLALVERAPDALPPALLDQVRPAAPFSLTLLAVTSHLLRFAHLLPLAALCSLTLPPACPPACPLLQLGIVHEWLGRPEKMQYQVVEATAARSASLVVLLHGVPPLLSSK